MGEPVKCRKIPNDWIQDVCLESFEVDGVAHTCNMSHGHQGPGHKCFCGQPSHDYRSGASYPMNSG